MSKAGTASAKVGVAAAGKGKARQSRSRPAGSAGKPTAAVRTTSPAHAPEVLKPRDRIIQAGLALLRQQGVAGLSQAAVARLAGVRQSHVTYYFPHRTDLIAALAAAAVAHMVEPHDDHPRPASLAELASRIAESAHMRMHIGLLVEADRDPAVRTIFRAAARPMLETVGALLQTDPDSDRTHAALAALWGLGLYRFAAGPGADDPAWDAALVALLTGTRT